MLATFYVDNSPTLAGPGADAFTATGGTQANVGGLTVGTDLFTTIQAAVNAAGPGDTINVADGAYSELVNVNDSVILRGNQFGVDGRSRAGANESIANGNAGSTSFFVTADDVVIDGFTVRDQTNVNLFGAGVYLQPGTAGTEFRNNVVTFNVVGLFLANDNSANPTVIERNRFEQNNNPGAASGTGIYTDQYVAGGSVDGVVIDDNHFIDNNSAGINFSSTDPINAPVTNVTISDNLFDGNGNALTLFSTTNTQITRNTIEGSLDNQIEILGGGNNIDITENFITGGQSRGILVADHPLVPVANQNITINNNSIAGNAGDGLEVAAGGYTGSLDAARNFWGDASGPTNPNNPAGTGQVIDDAGNQVDFSPFLTSDLDAQPGTPGFQPGGPVGVPAPGAIDVFNSKANSAFVTISTDSALDSIDAATLGTLSPGDGVVNLIGDNNNTSPQTDNFVIVGTGPNAFTVAINGSAPIQFTGVTHLNVVGHELVDTLDITAYADNTPQGWGIAVSFDEGLPNQTDGDQIDLLIYHTSLGLGGGGSVSEDISIVPAGPDNGELRVTNATDGSIVVVVQYVANTDIVVLDDDGSLSDTDTLTLHGTHPDTLAASGNDLFDADFTNAGTAADPLVTVTDEDAALILYRLRDFAGFSSIRFAGLAGEDTFLLTGEAGLAIHVDGGDPVAGLPAGIATTSDTVVVRATGDATIHQGPDAASGLVTQPGIGPINFVNVELLGAISSTTGSTLTINATDASDEVSVQAGGGAAEGLITVNAGPRIAVNPFFNADPQNFDILIINGGAGSDAFDVVPLPDIDQLIVGGSPAASDTLIVNGVDDVDDELVVNPTGNGAGTVVNTNIPALGPVYFTGIEHLSVVAQSSDNDGLRLNGTPFDDTIDVTPGPDSDAGRATGFSTGAVGFDFVPLAFSGFRDFTIFPETASGIDILRVNGTSADDSFIFSEVVAFPTYPVVTVNGSTPIFSRAETWVLRGLEGNDSFTVDLDPAPTDATGSIPLELRIEGGGSDPLGDTLEYVATPGAGLVTIDLATSTITQAGNSAVSFSGVERVDLDASGNAVAVNGTAGNDQIAVSHDAGLVTEFRRAGDNAAIRVANLAGSALTLDTLGGNDSTTVTGSAAADAVTVTYGATTTVAVAGQQTLSLTSANLENLTIATGTGSDAVTLVGTANIATVVDAGDPTANDTLTYTVAGNARVTQAAVSTTGKIDQTGGSDVDFVGVELLNISSTSTAGATLTVAATHDNDTIAAGLIGITAVWINDGTIIRYNVAGAAFTALTVQGRFGDDSFSIAPHAGVAITVQGGDPTASDTVVVNGTTSADTIVVTPTSSNSATVQVNALGLVTLQTVEHLTINGLGGNDVLTFTSPDLAAADLITLTPGVAPDSGAIDIQSVGLNALLLPIDYRNLGGSGSLVFADGAAGARRDFLTYRGTDREDVFGIDAGGVDLFGYINVETPGVVGMAVEGLDGNDIFNLDATAVFTSGVTVLGGNDGNTVGDEVFLTGDDTLIQINRAATPPPQILGGGLGNVQLVGVERIDVVNPDGDIELRSFNGPNLYKVTPWNPNEARIETGPNHPIFEIFSRGDLTIVDGIAGDGDTLEVHASPAAETIVVTPGSVQISGLKEILFVEATVESLRVFGHEGNDAFTVTPMASVPIFIDGGDPIGTIPGDSIVVLGAVGFFAGPENDAGGFLTMGATVSFDHIESMIVNPNGACPFLILGTNGDDDITVIARDTSFATFDTIATLGLIAPGAGFVDGIYANVALTGGTGTGATANITVVGGVVAAVTLFNPGRDFTAGDVLSADAANLGGAGAGFSIPVLAIANPAPVGLDGVQDFTVSVNGGPDILFIDEPDLFIDALSGDDDIVIRAPAPNDAPWDVNVRVAGGPPSIGEPNEGDRLVLETPGTDSIVFTATGPDTGSIVVDEDGDLAYTAASTDSIVTFGPFVFECDDPLGAPLEFTYISSPGGVELVEYDGEPGNDAITINGTAGDDLTTVNLQSRGGATGTFVSTASPLFRFRSFDAISVSGSPGGGFDHLIVNLTDEDDTLTSDANTLTLTSLSQVQTVTIGPSIDQFTLNALDGNDSIDLDLETNNFRTMVINAGAGNDTVNLSGMGPTLADTFIYGGAGDDLLVGSRSVDQMFGGDGNDLLYGLGNDDQLHGDDGNDRLEGGARDDQMFGGTGSDLFVWSPGEGSDQIEGQEGNDTLVFNGGAGNDLFTMSANGTRLQFDRLLGNITMDVAGVEEVNVNQTSQPLSGSNAVPPVNSAASGTVSLTYNPVTNTFDTTVFVAGVVAADITNARLRRGQVGATGPEIFDFLASGGVFLPVPGGLQMTLAGQTFPDPGLFQLTDVLDLLSGNVYLELSVPGHSIRSQIFALGATAATTGGDIFVVEDLFGTDVRFVNLNMGSDFDPIRDFVGVEGRDVSDDIAITADTATRRVSIVGLAYDVDIVGATPADGDELTVVGFGGNDTITASDDLGALFDTSDFRIFGRDGDDYISGFGTLRGDAGNDTLVGGAFEQTIDGGDGDDLIFGGGGDDTLLGGAGEDQFVGGLGNDTIDGGADFDTILLQATGGNDRIDAIQQSPTELLYEVSNVGAGFDGIVGGAGTETDTLASGTVEELRIVAGSGDDLIRVAHADSLIANVEQALSLRFTVDGGQPGASDRLTVSDLGLGDTTVHRIGGAAGSGSYQVGALAPVVYTEVEFTSLNPLNPVTGGTGADGLGTLFVFRHDPFEANDSRTSATFLGSNSAINVDPTIDPGVDSAGTGFDLPGDEDWYRIVAQHTGDLDIRVFHRIQGSLANGRAGLPGGGNLDIALYDADGLSAPATPFIVAGGGSFGTNDADDDERIRIPAVEGQTYYLRVRGAPAAGPLSNGTPDFPNTSDAVNVYNVSVINTPAPVPFDLELNDIIATGTVTVAPNGISFTANAALAAAAGFYDGKDIVFTGGPLNGIRGRVLSSIGATFTFAPGTFSALDVLPGLIGSSFQIESTDTGRSQFDNVTRDNTPTIFLRVADSRLLLDIPENGTSGEPGLPPDSAGGIANPILIPFVTDTTADSSGSGFRVAIVHVENNTHAIVGYAQPVDAVGQPGLYSFTFTTALAEGSHFLSARVEMVDPANPEQAQGLGALAQSLEIVVDTQVPPVFFGLPGAIGDGMIPDSDTGFNTNQETLDDGITTDTTPTFFGQAEANAIIRLFADVNGNGTFEPAIDVQVGFDVAEPFDGTNQYPPGYWQATSNINLNSDIFPQDGLRTIFVTAEDVAGNINPAAGVIELAIFLDTQGPQITDVEVGDDPNTAFDESGYDLFDPKPSTDGPSPLVNSIVISVQDLPPRVRGFLFPAIKADVADNPGHYQIKGDNNGFIPILDVVVVAPIPADPGPPPAEVLATATIELVFRLPGLDGVFNTADDIGKPLPDDRFTLIVSDEGVQDPAGNNLDGESNAAEPHNGPIFGVDGAPTGDGQPGGNFVARFTIDSRPELGVWAAGSAYLDLNGNSRFDPDSGDFANRDVSFSFGYTSDDLFSGKFMSANTPSDRNVLFDKLGAYGRVGTNTYRWIIDTDNDGVADIEVTDPARINGIPVAGNFGAFAGDEVGLFTGSRWHFDTNHDFRVDASVAWPLSGHPIVGDFDGDGFDDLGTWSNDTFSFDLSSIDTDGNAGDNVLVGIDGTIDRTFKFGFIGPGERPVAADMNADGIEDVGLWVPAREGVTPREGSEWYFLVSGVVQNNTGEPAAPGVQNPAIGANIGPTITGGNYPVAANGPGAFETPAQYGLANYTNGRIVTDPLLPNAQIVRFEPVPFGNDQYMQFGDEFGMPLVGNFDPPVSPSAGEGEEDPRNSHDVNDDGVVNALDILSIINRLVESGPGPAPTNLVGGPYYDVNADQSINALDLLSVINHIVAQYAVVSGEGEGEGADAFFSDSDAESDDDDDLISLLATDA
ncbi:MAG: dockerin type I domain-containing protein, partial [Pirellulaceae bacterium]